MQDFKMNKRGDVLLTAEAMEFIFLVVLTIVLFFSLNNIVDIEKYNGLRAEDLALTINSAYIPIGDVSFGYSTGSGQRRFIFEDGMVRTYIEDPIRIREGGLLHDSNYIFIGGAFDAEFLEIAKEGGSLTVR